MSAWKENPSQATKRKATRNQIFTFMVTAVCFETRMDGRNEVYLPILSISPVFQYRAINGQYISCVIHKQRYQEENASINYTVVLALSTSDCLFIPLADIKLVKGLLLMILVVLRAKYKLLFATTIFC